MIIQSHIALCLSLYICRRLLLLMPILPQSFDFDAMEFMLIVSVCFAVYIWLALCVTAMLPFVHPLSVDFHCVAALSCYLFNSKVVKRFIRTIVIDSRYSVWWLYTSLLKFQHISWHPGAINTTRVCQSRSTWQLHQLHRCTAKPNRNQQYQCLLLVPCRLKSWYPERDCVSRLLKQFYSWKVCSLFSYTFRSKNIFIRAFLRWCLLSHNTLHFPRSADLARSTVTVYTIYSILILAVPITFTRMKIYTFRFSIFKSPLADCYRTECVSNPMSTDKAPFLKILEEVLFTSHRFSSGLYFTFVQSHWACHF